MVEALIVAVEYRCQAVSVTVEHGNVSAVFGFENVGRPGRAHGIIASDSNDASGEIRKQTPNLVDGRVQKRTLGVYFQPKKLDLSLAEGRAHHGAWCAKTLENGLAHLNLGRDNHVNRQALAGKDILPGRVNIGLVPDPSDLVGHGKQRVGNLADHHIDFIKMRDRDDHLAVSRA